jgi:hypothetical protein
VVVKELVGGRGGGRRKLRRNLENKRYSLRTISYNVRFLVILLQKFNQIEFAGVHKEMSSIWADE